MTKTRDLADLGGGFIQAGGAVQRTVESKLQDVVSVKDFGAVGDGVVDDTNAIKATLNWANTQLPRKSVYFPRGTYRITSEINQCHPHGDAGIPVGTKAFGDVYGDGMNATELVFENTQYCWVVGSKTAFAGLSGGLKGVYQFGLRDLKITGKNNTCENGVWVGGCHFGNITNVRVEGFTGKNFTLYGNYGGGGTGCLWNNLTNINIAGAGPSYTGCYGLYVGAGANACSFSNIFVNVCRFGYYNGGGRNRFFGISGECQQPAQYMFGIAAQTAVYGTEFEVTGGGGTVPTAWSILDPFCRSSIHDSKIIGFNSHYVNNSGISFPEVSFVNSTYESTDVGDGPIFQNVRLKPIVDRVLIPSRLRQGTGTFSIGVAPAWTSFGNGLSDPNGKYSGSTGYFAQIPQKIVFTRSDTSAYLDIQVAFTPFAGNADYIALTGFAPGEGTKTVTYQDFMDAVITKGYYNETISPIFRARTSHTSPQDLTLNAAYLVSA